jgi:hypothetical protein
MATAAVECAHICPDAPAEDKKKAIALQQNLWIHWKANTSCGKTTSGENQRLVREH